ncbi:phosphoribosyltransferase-like protein [Stenotrophomonas maltophilia]|uniref:phosphoribosyltransferase-like protein n=1 Tax=Stenotrophomonas maltophilia TaxID=40324 RepID=UPI001F539997|nr:hypothetical protein [Stenotrophomonas maltophilia]MCI1057051.1 hypothetical protein [Stenotrophomonas maltophilia]MCI1062019.1 hypothetical protein [Stenotrophomonas maltophilia]MCI1078937.1 hypothetical protein [Stenotrophomonas maltophilia]MCI1084011.1 hypothetical protein [Stenotrophomonas maltophilia]MCI1095190.1 hypothetical protein [Stenotrophomonas maltophilia]
MSDVVHELTSKLQALSDHAWDSEVRWPVIDAWRNNFVGTHGGADEERYSLFMLTKFMYFSKNLMREMLKSLYRDKFEGPEVQRIRRNFGGTLDSQLVRGHYEQHLRHTRFIGVGNPSESGAHLLYYFRQINGLSKDLFSDFHRAFSARVGPASGRSAGVTVSYEPRDADISNYVFFDDLVGSGSQVAGYLTNELAALRSSHPNIRLQFLSLFATTEGLERLNSPKLFDGQASTLFEMDGTFKAFEANSRYFKGCPAWFDIGVARNMVSLYGESLFPGRGLGYKDGQLLMGFTHNTPDNVPCIFWSPGRDGKWNPVFLRYDKNYEEVT